MNSLGLYMFLLPLLLVVLWRMRNLEDKVRKLKVLSTRDELTGALNRRGGEEALRHQEKISQRSKAREKKFSIITFDLNNFKNINDTFGHPVGDLVLKFFLKMLQEILRKDYDIVVRPGGDEFYAILPECSLTEAKLIRTKIKSKFQCERFCQSGISMFISTSIGIATSHKKNGRLRSANEMFRLADRILYSDKARKS